MDVLYTAEATAWGGREGRAASSDGNLELQLVIPKELGGPGGPGTTNPEQLFAAGYAGCFHSALKRVAKKAGVDVSESAVTAKVGLGMNEHGHFGLTVELTAELPDVPPSRPTNCWPKPTRCARTPTPRGATSTWNSASTKTDRR